GEGGQKVVYLVRDEALDRECALSMIRSELLDPGDMQRLRHEAQSMARLGAHSNIVTVYDIGQEDGKPYLVSEYVPGGDLRQEMLCGRAPFADGSPAAVIAQVLNARPVAPTTLNSEVPAALEALILQLLAKSPEMRPANAIRVGEALRFIIDDLRKPARA